MLLVDLLFKNATIRDLDLDLVYFTRRSIRILFKNATIRDLDLFRIDIVPVRSLRLGLAVANSPSWRDERARCGQARQGVSVGICGRATSLGSSWLQG